MDLSTARRAGLALLPRGVPVELNASILCAVSDGVQWRASAAFAALHAWWHRGDGAARRRAEIEIRPRAGDDGALVNE